MLSQEKGVFQVVTYFLVHSLASFQPDYAPWFDKLKRLFPCLDHSMEGEFRGVACDFFVSLRKDADFEHDEVSFATVLANPGKFQFLLLYVKFSSFVLVKAAHPETRQRIRSTLKLSPQAMEKACKQSMANTVRLRNECKAVKDQSCSIIDESQTRLAHCVKVRDGAKQALQSLTQCADSERETVGDVNSLLSLVLGEKLSHIVPVLTDQLVHDLRWRDVDADSHLAAQVDIVARMKGWAGVADNTSALMYSGKKAHNLSCRPLTHVLFRLASSLRRCHRMHGAEKCRSKCDDFED